MPPLFYYIVKGFVDMDFYPLSGTDWILCHEYISEDQDRCKTHVCHYEDENILEVIRYSYSHSYYIYKILRIIRSTRTLIEVECTIEGCMDFRDIQWSGEDYETYRSLFLDLFGYEPPGKPIRELIVRIKREG